jgi:gamma-glutamyl-gamma-aminobutyrate hydrolase PuuD
VQLLEEEEGLVPILGICRHLPKLKVILKKILHNNRRIMKKFRGCNY